MQLNINEIQKVLVERNYSINNIIFDIMKKFKFKSLCCDIKVKKADRYSTSEIITFLVLIPLMLLKTVNSLYKSQYKTITSMKSNT